MGFIYAAEDRWDRVHASLLRAADRGESVGLDTEFYGDPDHLGQSFDVRKCSCAGGRARVHMWSVAVKRFPHVLHPRGYHVADAAVLLSGALDHPGLRDWLTSSTRKVVHNLSVDAHALDSHGIRLGGAVNSLAHSRWVWPERARGRGFGLDSLGWDILGAGKTEGYDDIFSEQVEELVKVKQVKSKSCSCGEPKCRKRKGHEKTESVVDVPVYKTATRDIPLQTVVPGHSRWERAVAYSARDAVLALNLDDKITREMKRSAPWPW